MNNMHTDPIKLAQFMRKMEKIVFCPGCGIKYPIIEISDKEVKCQDCGVVYRQAECIVRPQKI